MKKTFSFFLLSLLTISFLPGLIQAQGPCPSEGLVPCGTPGCPCTLCHFFEMIERIVNTILFKIVPVLAALMISIGGFMYVIAYTGMFEAGPETLSRAKSLFKSVIIGLLIAYGAWLIVNTFFWAIGVSDWTGLKHGWWQINCNI